MTSSTPYLFSDRDPRLPKLSINTRIGPTTPLIPPAAMPKSIEGISKMLSLPSLKPFKVHELDAHPTNFLDFLEKKYSSNPNTDYVDFTSKIQKSKPITFAWNAKNTYGNTPSSRVSGTLTSINNNLYLFGGQCGDRLNEIKILNYETLHWDTVNAVKDMETPEPRDGHTTLSYKHYLVVYGGAGAFNSILHTRTCSPLFYLFDTQTLHWKIHKPLGRLPDPRRNHGAASIGCTMILYGGIGNNNDVLCDIEGVNLESMQWISLRFTKESVKPGYRHSFTMTSVYHSAMFKLSNPEMFNLPAVYDDDFTRKNCGIYIFGGMNEHGNVLNDLYLIQGIKKHLKSDNFR